MSRSLVLLFASLSALALPGAALSDDVAPGISPRDLHERQQRESAPLVLDVRTAAEFDAGHVPGAVNIPHSALASRIGELPLDNGVVVYCMKGPRARLGENTLREAGVERILHLDGGFNAWRESGLPVSSGAE